MLYNVRDSSNNPLMSAQSVIEFERQYEDYIKTTTQSTKWTDYVSSQLQIKMNNSDFQKRVYENIYLVNLFKAMDNSLDKFKKIYKPGFILCG